MRPLAILSLVFALATTAFGREVYELRTYQLKSAEKAASFDKMMAAAAPAIERAGAGPVAVFKYQRPEDGDPNWRIVLTAAKSLNDLVELPRKLAEDAEFTPEAMDYLMQEKSDPAFARIAVSTFLAFEGIPKLVAPAAAEKPDERFFELRIYESHSEYKAFMKVKMFNEGELDIFKDVGLNSVWFGQALAGDNLPNLTYMLAYDSKEHHKKAWDAFRKAPAWQALKSEEQYKDTVSKITSKFLVAMPYSGVK